MTHDTGISDFLASERSFDSLTTRIVCAYVSNNVLPAGEVPGFIASVHAAVVDMGRPPAAPIVEPVAVPAVPVGKSVFPDRLVSLIDGKSYKTLKRHLGRHGLDPNGYRARYGLKPDYPVVCSDYSAVRTKLAKDIGLGKKRAAASA